MQSRLTTCCYIFFLLISTMGCQNPSQNKTPDNQTVTATEYDAVLYGATPPAITAAIELSKHGHNCLILAQTQHIGGLTTGGLGWTDYGIAATIGGLSKAFYHQVYLHYQQDSAWPHQNTSEYPAQHHVDHNNQVMWSHEPRVASLIFDRWIKKHNLTIWQNAVIDYQNPNAVVVSNKRIQQITLTDGRTIKAKYFFDCSYEGDLLAASGVSYHVGREATDVYGESLNGVIDPFNNDFRKPKAFFGKEVSPYDAEGNLLPGIQDVELKAPGSGDTIIQAYCFRTCLTTAPENRLPIPKPDNYQRYNFELLARYILAQDTSQLQLGQLLKLSPMPNHKTDINDKCPFSMDYIGANWAYPNGSLALRDSIWKAHIDYTLGLFYFLANDTVVPLGVRRAMQQYGLPKDEYTANGHWSPQLYVREARRMKGAYIMTQRDCLEQGEKSTSVGCGSYAPDSHHCQRLVVNGQVINEGNMLLHKQAYEIPYNAIVPKKEECENLLVPACLSSSHVAYGSIRMEPVFMILGQSAGAAAHLALKKGNIPVQDVPYAELKPLLEAGGQFLKIENLPQ